MKTFLHYTKEKELDEGFMDRVRAGAEKVGDTAEKIGSAINTVRKNPFMGLLKKGAGGAAIGQAFGDYATQRKENRERCLRIKSREYKRIERLRDDAKTSGATEDESYYNDALDDLKKEYKELKCSGSLP